MSNQITPRYRSNVCTVCISISLQPLSCWTLGQMLPQPINSPECHALHVMYVLYVCVCVRYLVHCCGFSLSSRKANTHITLHFKLWNSGFISAERKNSFKNLRTVELTVFFKADNIKRQRRRREDLNVHTCVYLAIGLDSTAYTLVAPAWTAKKDRIPEPQHTSRTTYRDRKREGG